MPGGYEIRRAERRHLREIPALEQAALSLFPTEDIPDRLRWRVTAREALREAQQDGRLWIAEDASGHTVGFALADTVDGEAYLTEVDVHPDHARRGLGTRLVRTVIEWAGREGFAQLLLVTFRHLPWNAPFYLKLGFAPVAEERLGPELAGILADEARAGIDVRKRVAMQLEL